MSKQVMIGLFALSLVALVWTDADAGCCCNPRICASWISGSGYSTGLVTQDVQKDAPESIACEVVTFTGFVDKCQPATDPNCQSKVSLTLRLLGTDGTNCGFGDQKTESCGIKGFAVCGTSTNKKVIIPGPLNVCSPGGSYSLTAAANLRTSGSRSTILRSNRLSVGQTLSKRLLLKKGTSRHVSQWWTAKVLLTPIAIGSFAQWTRAASAVTFRGSITANN
jgi:hypothetical protein